jgi:hypothetical protein
MKPKMLLDKAGSLQTEADRCDTCTGPSGLCVARNFDKQQFKKNRIAFRYSQPVGLQAILRNPCFPCFFDMIARVYFIDRDRFSLKLHVVSLSRKLDRCQVTRYTD